MLGIISSSSLRLSIRLLIRDWRAGELRVLLAAVMIAVACVSSVAFFTDRISQALQQQTGELLGADLRVVADHPLAATMLGLAQSNHLTTAETRSFRSMILAGENKVKGPAGDREGALGHKVNDSAGGREGGLGQSRLAEIKAVSSGYPLRGALKIAPALFAADHVTQELPKPGEAWAGPQLLQQLGLNVGDFVQVGNLSLRISAVLSYEPDRSGNLFSIAPRLLMNLTDLSSTGLVQEGSHIHHALLVSGKTSAVEDFRKKIKPQLKRGERIEGAADARPEVRAALTRAQQFLGLAAVVAVMLACVAIAMSARRFAQRHRDTCAMLRCFGASQRLINFLFLFQLLWLGMLAATLGVLFAYLAQQGLVALLGDLILARLPSPSWTPVLIGYLVALGGLLGFAMPPILQLREVPTLHVLQGESSHGENQQQENSKHWHPAVVICYVSGLAALAALVMYQAGDVALGKVLLLGLLLTSMAFWLVAAILLWGLNYFLKRGQSSFSARSAWQFGLLNLTKRSAASIAQIMAFGVGLTVLLLLTVVRSDLLQGWADGLPADAPNRFVINIQPDQLVAVKNFFRQRGMPEVELFPMVRGRLAAINDVPINSEKFSNARARNLAERETNLSWAKKLQADNEIVAGRWWQEASQNGASQADGRTKYLAEFSVEEGIAKTLGITLGDRLTYNIAGTEFTATVSSLRSVQWDSFHANFFVLASPGVLDDYPASYITSFFLPADNANVLDALVRQFPNLTVIDIAAIMDQVRTIITRVSLAVEYVFLFTLAAGLMVMIAAIQSTLDVRLHENAVLRALGARRRRLWQSLASEFFTLGALSGGMAALFASALGYVIATQVLDLEYVINPWLWVVGLFVGGVGVGLAGVIGTRQVVNSPPLKVLQKV